MRGTVIAFSDGRQPMKHRTGPDEPGDDARRARRRRRARLLRTAALSVVGALGGVVIAADVKVPVGPFTSTFLARPALDGRTTVSLAPLGTIRLDTHDAPLAIDVRVEELRLDEAELIARDPAVLEGSNRTWWRTPSRRYAASRCAPRWLLCSEPSPARWSAPWPGGRSSSAA